MSRIGKKPIIIPEGVEAKLDGNNIIAKGPKGEIKLKIHPEVKIEIKEKQIQVLPCKTSKKTNAIWGLTRALVFNMIKGVSQGYEKKLELQGIGYKAKIEKNKLILNIGFSHPVEVEEPQDIKFSVEKNIINISGADKESVGQIAAKIRAVKPPEPYKGKGIRYVGETVKIKAGKKVVAAAT